MVKVSVTVQKSCALKADGTAWCWGYGALGDGLAHPSPGGGVLVSSATPVMVAAADVVDLDVGQSHSCLRLSDGSMRCWGDDGSGALGQGWTCLRWTHPEISEISHLRCFGQDAAQHLAQGILSNSLTPVSPVAQSGVVDVSARQFHSCAVHEDGTVVCWGHNGYGQLGNGEVTEEIPEMVETIMPPNPEPTAVVGLTDAVSVGNGNLFTCALRQAGGVRCWGLNQQGALGDGTDMQSPVPVDVAGVSDATELSVGAAASCVLMPAGTVKCWGSNNLGQLGDGTTTTRTTAVDVLGLT